MRKTRETSDELEWLNRQGYSVLRFWNAEILQGARCRLDASISVLTDQIVERCDAIRF